MKIICDSCRKEKVYETFIPLANYYSNEIPKGWYKNSKGRDLGSAHFCPDCGSIKDIIE